MASNLTQRVLVAVVAIPATIAVIWLGGWPLAILLALVAWLGTSELYALAQRTGTRPLTGFGRWIAAAIPLLLAGMMTNSTVLSWVDEWWVWALFAVVIVSLIVAVFVRTPTDRPLDAIGVTLFGVCYASAMPCTLFFIRHARWPFRSWDGTAAVLFPLVVVWVCDTAAMTAGRMIGGAKLIPSISPGKTRVGAIAGAVAGMLVGWGYVALIGPQVDLRMSPIDGAVAGLVLAVLGQCGDLAESLFKRGAGVKDSSNLIPGHGGVLDRLDSLYVVLPSTAIAYHLIGVL